MIDAQAGQILELGRGARLRVLAVEPRGALLLLGWENFRALLPVGLDFDRMDALIKDRQLTTVTALLLADGLRPAQPARVDQALRGCRWSFSAWRWGHAEGKPDPQVLQAVQGDTFCGRT